MAQHALSHHAMASAPAGRTGAGLASLVFDRFLLMPLGVAIALVWANVAGESYFQFAHALAFPVNEIGMALFLGLVAQEAFEAVMPGGALHTWRRWGVPVVAAAGGLAGSAFAFLTFVYLKHEEVLAPAWPIACTIDVAAAYVALRMIYRRGSEMAFFLVMAIVTDAAALLVMLAWAPFSAGHVIGAILLVLAVLLAARLHLSHVRAFWPYLIVCGSLSWVGLYIAGIHPALALVPLVPFLPHEPRPVDDVFDDVADDDAVHHTEHEWHEVVQIVLFLFAVVNAGVLLRGYDTGTYAVLVAALAGRPLGILAAAGLASAAGLALPRRITGLDLVVIAFAASTGFTLALFFATGLLPVGAVLQQIKFGALLTAAGVVVALAVARVRHVGRFAARDA